MDNLEGVTTVKGCATPARGYWKRLVLLFLFPAALALQTVAQAQTCRLNAGWPAFDYDGKPAQADGSYSKTTVAGSQIETAHYAAESRTMTAADGRLQVRLDCKEYKNLPVEEYAVLLTNLSKTESTGITANFRSCLLYTSPSPRD